MRIGNRAGAIGLMVSVALAIGAQPSSAAIEPPVRQFAARYRATLSPGPSPVSIGRTPTTHTTPARVLVVSGAGAAMWQGPSSISGQLAIRGNGLCQSFKGSAVLAAGPSPVFGPPVPALPMSLTGLLCTPQEGAGMSIWGSYRTQPRPGVGVGGSGSFRAIAVGPNPNNTTSVIVYFKGTM